MIVGLALTLIVVGCGDGWLQNREGDEAILVAPAVAARTVVDSVVPIPAALERFRAELPGVTTLRGGADSVEGLVLEVARLLEQSDTLGFEGITINAAEFAYLYYESTPLARPPYEMPPALMWFQLQQANRTGVFRLMREFAGREMGVVQAACDTPSEPQGESRIHA